MSILNFVNQDQLDDLDEDPKIAFMELINLAQRSLSDQVKNLDEEDRSDWAKIEELRLSFMNVVIASAKQYEIEPFLSMDVPARDQFGNHDFQQFKFDTDHYVTQLVLGNSLRARRDSVEILPKTKDTLRGYVSALRDCLEKGNLGDKKREALLKRLDALEAELEKRRVNMMAVARVAFALWAIPGATWQSYDVANKLITNLMTSVAEAKETEESQKKLPESQHPKALSPPRKEVPSLFAKSSGALGDDLDDDIPF